MHITALRTLLVATGVIALGACAPRSHLIVPHAGTPTFEPCPLPPRCATTRADGAGRGGDVLAPIDAGEDAASAHARLLAVLAADARYRVLSDDGRYVHTEFTTQRMRYRDDVEFLIREDGVVDVRSAARIGWYDWETNRRRIEALRTALRP